MLDPSRIDPDNRATWPTALAILAMAHGSARGRMENAKCVAEMIGDIARERDEARAELERIKFIKCSHPNVAQCAREWSADTNRRQLESVDPTLADEFPFDCDTVQHLAEALVVARAEVGRMRPVVEAGIRVLEHTAQHQSYECVFTAMLNLLDKIKKYAESKP